jgi:hypothetical protein
MSKFEWIDNPDKDIADSTRTVYKRRLNALAKQGYGNKESLLINAAAVRKIIDENESRQMRCLYYGAIFYILGRVDKNDPRGAILVDGFQKNYYGDKGKPIE